MPPHRKEHQTHFLFIFLFLPRVEYGVHPRYQDSLLLFSRRGSWKRGYKKHGEPYGDYKLLQNAANYDLLFWGQKVFLMAGRSPLKCDNSN